MAQAVSHQPLTAETRVRARAIPHGICDGQSGTGQVLYRVLRFSLVSIIPSALHTHYTAMNSRLVGGCSSET
jgi:hypothetical protein